LTQVWLSNITHRLKYLIPAVLLGVILVDQTGVLLHMSEKDFHTEFQYPLKGDIKVYMEQLRMGKELDQVYFLH